MDSLSHLYDSYYGVPPDSIVPITGSGSNRSYFRLSSEAGTCIGVKGTDVMENRAFIALSAHFRSKGINVPEVFAVSGDAMCYIQEDVGGTHLYDLISSAGKGDCLPEDQLCRTMAALPKIQFEGARGLDFSICYPQPSFDRRMVMFDLNYFKYCFLKASGLEFNENLLQDDFERFADDLLAEDSDVPTFMYRDFQPRNVMIKDGEPYFIDFQGGRRGPLHYDVASFVWHARSGFPEKLRKRMTDAYLTALAEYVAVDRPVFEATLRKFVLFRLLQVLGAYGFRGLVENKANFMVSIPSAMESLRSLLEEPFVEYPYLMQTLRNLSGLPRFVSSTDKDGKMEVRIYSFSFKKGIPYDPSGNGGGYVFDCRYVHNPGRYEQYRHLTGNDVPVIRFLEEDGEIAGFLDHVYGLVDPHVENFLSRGFSNLMVSFGCTGGRHRSVYCAEHLARHLADRYPDVRIRLIHREQGTEEVLQ